MPMLRSLRKAFFRRIQTRTVRLDRLLTGGFAEREHRPLARSPHVAFLREFGFDVEIDPERFRESPYYAHALQDIERSGSFFGIAEPDRIIEQAHYFLTLYRSVRDGTGAPNDPTGTALTDLRSTDPLPQVARVRGTRYFVIKDGHHRFAAHLVAGRDRLRARNIGHAILSAEGLGEVLRSVEMVERPRH